MRTPRSYLFIFLLYSFCSGCPALVLVSEQTPICLKHRRSQSRTRKKSPKKKKKKKNSIHRIFFCHQKLTQQTPWPDLVRFFQEVSSHATTHWKANTAIPCLSDHTTVSPTTILFLILHHHDPQFPSTMPPQSLHKLAIPSQR